MFQPEDQPRPVLSADVVDPPVAIDVQSSTLDDANTGPEQSRLPTGRAEERNLALVLDVSADHIQAARAGEIPGCGGLVAEPLDDDVAGPR